MAKKLISREKVPFAPGENTYGLEIIKEVWENDDGSQEIRWKYSIPNMVQIFGLTVEGNVIAIKEFQPGVGTDYLHLPGGIMEGEETPPQAGVRELLEETGYKAGSIKLLSSVLENSGKSDRTIYLMMALNCVKVSGGEKEIKTILLRPVEFWQRLMQYFFFDPLAKHGGGNSLKAAALACQDLGLIKF